MFKRQEQVTGRKLTHPHTWDVSIIVNKAPCVCLEIQFQDMVIDCEVNPQESVRRTHLNLIAAPLLSEFLGTETHLHPYTDQIHQTHI